MVLFAFNGILLGLWEIHVLSLLDSRTLSNIWAKRSSSGHELRLVCSCFLAELCAFFSQVRCWCDLDVSLIVLLDICHPTVFLFFLCFIYLSCFFSWFSLDFLLFLFCCLFSTSCTSHFNKHCLYHPKLSELVSTSWYRSQFSGWKAFFSEREA